VLLSRVDSLALRRAAGRGDFARTSRQRGGRIFVRQNYRGQVRFPSRLDETRHRQAAQWFPVGSGN